MCRLQLMGILGLVGLAASLIGAGWCPAEVTETFDKSADRFPGDIYGNWRVSSSEGAARVADGVLEVRRTERPGETSFVWATRTSSELFATATLIEKFPKGFTVAGPRGGAAGWGGGRGPTATPQFCGPKGGLPPHPSHPKTQTKGRSYSTLFQFSPQRGRGCTLAVNCSR